MNDQDVLSPILGSQPNGEKIERIINSAIAAVGPEVLIKKRIELGEDYFRIGQTKYFFSKYKEINLLALGKAGITMAKALDTLFHDHISRQMVVTKHPPKSPIRDVEIVIGDHPIPGERSRVAGSKVAKLLGEMSRDDMLIFLLSGGGSSLLASPIPPISIPELQWLTENLLRSGASIDEINVIRRHIESLKGGGFLQATDASILTLILSDVVGNRLEAIASGPTAPDPSTKEEAIQILEKYDLMVEAPHSILDVLGKNETIKQNDARFSRVENIIFGNNLVAAQAALKSAEDEGFHPYLLRADLHGEARDVAIDLCQSLRWAIQRGDPVVRPFCMVAGGETTVAVKGNGKGGRNTELALAAVSEIAGLPDVMLVTLATDGEDGITDAAGAVVTGDTWKKAEELGLHPVDFLQRNDSYPFFSAVGSLLKTGPTGTNVNDLVLLFGF